MKIYLQMEGDKLVKLVPLERYNAIKRELETQLERTKKAADLRIARQRKALAALNREIRSSQKRERDAAGELTNMRIYEGIVQAVRTILKAGREEKTEDAAKRIAALGKTTEPPTVDGKTPGQVMHEAMNGCGKWKESSYRDEYEAAASAVLAAFGNQSQTTEIPWIEWHGGECPLKDEDVEEWRYKFADGFTTNTPAEPSAYQLSWSHAAGVNSIIAYRVLKWRDGCGPVENQMTLQRQLEAAMTRIGVEHTEMKVQQTRAEKAEAEVEMWKGEAERYCNSANRYHSEAVRAGAETEQLRAEIERTRFYLITPPTDGSDASEWIMRMFRKSIESSKLADKPVIPSGIEPTTL